jgi:hypothetical protein
MRCFNSNGASNAIYVNKVSQTLTGTNTGHWFGDFTQTEVRTGLIDRVSSSITGATDIRMILYVNRVLTTQERSDIYDYCNNKGMFV